MCNKNAYEELDCAIDLSLTRPHSPTVVMFPLTSLGPTKTSANKNVPSAGTSNSGDKKQNVDADASKTKAAIRLPKKRPYVDPQIQTEEKQITPIMDIVTKQTEKVKEVIAGSQTEPLRNRSEVSDEKSQELELAASDKPTVKPARETGKKQSQKASTSQPSTSQPSTSQPSKSKPSTLQPSTSQPSKLQPSKSQPSESQPSISKASTSKASTSLPSTSQPSTSQPSKLQPSKSQPSESQPSTSQASISKASTSKASTSKASTSKTSTSKASKSKASTSKVSTSKTSTSKASKSKASTSKASTSGPKLSSGNKPSASTSVASSSSSSRINDSQFWVETVHSKFRSSDYKNLLRESNFTEPQAESLQNFFYQAARKFYNTFMNSDRVMKMHKCRDCLFSIRHQCVSISFLHAGLANGDPTATTLIAPQETIICICQFAFFHAHITGPSCSKTVNIVTSKRTSLRCAVCDTMVTIEHSLEENTDCTLTKWSAINSSNEKTFHAEVVDHIKKFTPKTLSLEELYICNYQCCLFFHRCDE